MKETALMRVFVAGASGWIGSATGEELLTGVVSRQVHRR
jgi:nucleoside-diphosphate-sugar epimerase